MMSVDEGNTIKKLDNTTIAFVTTNSIKMRAGNILAIEKVVIVKYKNGDPSYALRLSNGFTWIVSKMKGTCSVENL